MFHTHTLLFLLVAPLSLAPLLATAQEIGSDQRQPVPTTRVDQRATEPRCALTGLVVDEKGEACANVAVKIQWTTEREGVVLKEDLSNYWERVERHVHRTRTDEQGRFRLEAPVPPEGKCWLGIDCDPLHRAPHKSFGWGSDHRPLAEGEHDLGTIELELVGAIRGTVVDRAGKPIGGAFVQRGWGPGSPGEAWARTAEDGSYVLGHVRPFKGGVSVELDGYRSEFQDEVAITPGRFVEGVDFTLTSTFPLRGRVVDETGRPLRKVNVSVKDEESGCSASEHTDADGRFVLQLWEEKPHRLELRFEGYEVPDGAELLFEPGSREIEIVLHRLPTTRFVVVDDETSDPIESYGLEIHHGRGKLANWSSDIVIGGEWPHAQHHRPRPEEHPGGIVELWARPGYDLFGVCAPGYLPLSGEVEPEDRDGPVQVLRLRRGASIRGRVLRGDAPEGDVSVRLVSGRNRPVWPDGHPPRTVETRGGLTIITPRPGEKPIPPETRFEPDHVIRMEGTTDERGEYLFRGLYPGTYVLEVRAVDGTIALIGPCGLEPDETLLFPDARLRPAGIVAGRVLVPPGCSPEGLLVRTGSWQKWHEARTSKAGEFRFEGLMPGKHEISVQGMRGEFERKGDIEVEVELGKTTPLTVDLRDSGLCELTLTVTTATAGPRFDVYLVPIDRPDRRVRFATMRSGETETKHVLALGAVRVELEYHRGIVVPHPTAVLTLPLLDTIEQTLHVETGQLAIELPDGAVLPKRGWLEIALAPRKESSGVPSQEVRLFCDHGTDYDWMSVHQERSGRVRFDALPPGDYRMSLKLTDHSRPLEAVIDPETGEKSYEWDPILQRQRDLFIVAGILTEVKLD